MPPCPRPGCPPQHHALPGEGTTRGYLKRESQPACNFVRDFRPQSWLRDGTTSTQSWGPGTRAPRHGQMGVLAQLVLLAAATVAPQDAQAQRSKYLQYACNPSSRECARRMFDVRARCGGAPSLTAAALPGTPSSCPSWLQREIDEACEACAQPSCSEHATPADERFFFQGVQEKYGAQNTKGWRQELETCGGRALKCSLEKCEPKYEVKRRYANEKCLGVPAQVVFRRVSRSVLDLFPGNLTCQPKWCTAVRSKAAGAAPVYYEETACTSEVVGKDQKFPGKLKIPSGSYLANVFYAAGAGSGGVEGGGTGMCMPKDIELVDLKLHVACVPDQDPFRPDTWGSVTSYVQYNCYNRSLASGCNADCSKCTNIRDVRPELGKCAGIQKTVLSNYSSGQASTRSYSTTSFRANADRCTFFAVTSYFNRKDGSKAAGAATCAAPAMPIAQVMRDNKATRGRACIPQTCAEVLLGDGNKTGLYKDVKCYDSVPAVPGTPEGGPGSYLVESTWYNPQCKDSGMETNVRLALKHGECVLHPVKADGTFVRLDLGASVLRHYPVGDSKCKKQIRSESFKTSIGNKCHPRYVCGGTSDYDTANNDPTKGTPQDCMTNFVTMAVERNSATSTRTDRLFSVLPPLLMLFFHVCV